jgi:tripartite-type tricarboxylate transporter receptor subunit TctC
MKAKVWSIAACVIASLLLTLSATASAQEFYQDKRIRLIVGFPPGGGYDLYTRAIGRHLSRHIPGNPSIIVQNMPGAGSAVAANYLYGPASQDGTVFGTITPAQVLRDMLGAPGVAFSSEKFNWLVAASAEDVFTCIANAHLGVKTIDDVLKRDQPLVVGGYSPGDFTVMVPQFYKEILGVNLTVVPGYPGTAGIRAAMERKEVEAGCWQWSSVKVTAKPMLDAGSAVVFSQLGPRKAPELPHVENAAERVKAETDRTVMTALFSQLSLGRPYIAPPGVPENRVRVLRKAFMDMLQDPKFLEEANRLNLEVGPLSGDEAQKLVAKLKAAPPTILEKLKTIVGTGGS